MKRRFKIQNLRFKISMSEEGFVLVVALLLLLVVTVIGVATLLTSTTEVMMAGNQRLREISFAGADSGLEIADPVIRYVTSYEDTGNYAEIVSDANLSQELRIGPSFDVDTLVDNPDIELKNFGGTMNVRIDIDRMYSGPCPGSAMDLLSGYEGIGMGGGGSICLYYRVNSMSRDDLGSESIIGGVYRYIAY